MSSVIVLSEDDFSSIVRGKAIVKDGIAIVLSDIGWDRMYFHIERAMRDAGVADL